MSAFNTDDSDKVKYGPIIYIEDSTGDQMLFEMALQELNVPNELKMFSDGAEALIFLKEMKTMPFMIISDVNMPKMDGFELKHEIEKDEELTVKAIPFMYLSASAARKDVKTAFYHQAQGYFEKPGDLAGLIKVLKLMIEYWSTSALPLNF